MTEPFVHLSLGFNFLLLVIIIIIINTSIVIVMIVIINIIAKKGRYCGGLSKHIFPNQLKAWLFRILSATLIKTWLPRLKIEKRQKLFSNRPNWPPSPHIAPQVHSHALISTETTPLSPNLRRRYIVIEKPLMTIMPIKISTSKTYFCCQLIMVHLFCGQARHFSGFKTRQFCQSWGLV